MASTRRHPAAAFAQAYFAPPSERGHARLMTLTDAAFSAARELDDDERLALLDALRRFLRFYSFLSQVLPFVPPDTERLHVFGRFLADRLANERPEGGMSLPVRWTSPTTASSARAPPTSG